MSEHLHTPIGPRAERGSVAGNRAELVHALKGRDGVQGVTAQASDTDLVTRSPNWLALCGGRCRGSSRRRRPINAQQPREAGQRLCGRRRRSIYEHRKEVMIMASYGQPLLRQEVDRQENKEPQQRRVIGALGLAAYTITTRGLRAIRQHVERTPASLHWRRWADA
jgi:hypothetical protein